MCEEYQKTLKCENSECADRHPKVCKWMENDVGCKRSECDYLHVPFVNDKHEEESSGKFKCISCKHIWNDKSCVVEHLLGNHLTFFCLNCDDWVRQKTRVLEEGWSLLDEAGNLRYDV